jgi:AcrR family transcriptional regulator
LSKILDNPRQAIFNAACDIFYNQGHTALNMRDVAKQSGIALGTIYNYFPSRQALVLDMMSAYWDDFMDRSGLIIHSTDDFYAKLRTLFAELGGFIGKFHEVWLRPELYSTPEIVQSGQVRHAGYIERFMKGVEALLVQEAEKPDAAVKLRYGPGETSKFIVMNFITMIQMPAFRYDTFEIMLKDLLRNNP